MSLTVSSLNCRGFNSVINGYNTLFNDANTQVLLLQETWLAKQELGVLNSLDKYVQGFGVATVNYEDSHTVGRKYGGLAFMWKTELDDSFFIKPVNYDVDWVIGLELVDKSSNIIYLLINVYLPYKCEDNLNDYIECLGTLQQIIEEAPTSNIMVGGDFNCDPRIADDYGTHLIDFCNDTSLNIADVKLLRDSTFTYVSDAWGTTSWIDHCLCSTDMLTIISNMEVDYGFVLSDHRPLKVSFECNKSPLVEQATQEAVFTCSAKWNDIKSRDKYNRITATLLEKSEYS